MDVKDLLTDLFARVDAHVHEAVDGLSREALTTPPEEGTNTIGWLVWHLTRVQDHHIADILDQEQVWVTGDWAGRFGLTAEPDNTGYGHDAAEMLSVRAESSGALIEYYQAVAAVTAGLISTTTPEQLDRVVDERWDPPVTMGVRLISIADDDIQHAAQAVYARGMFERR